MAGLADTFDDTVADVAANAGDDADRQLPRDQNRALFDMQFDPGGDALGIQQRRLALFRCGRHRRRRRACIRQA
jgi:hypothetical protein